jgi:Dicarboxylate transport
LREAGKMRAWRYILGALVLLAVVAAGLTLARLPIAGFAVRAAMSGAGLENPKARVTGLSLEKITLTGLAAGPEGHEAFRIDAVEARYQWRELLFERRVDATTVGPGEARLEVAPDGTVTLPGMKQQSGGGGVGALPFDRFTARDIRLVVDVPRGSATGALDADYDAASGGGVSLQLQAQNAGSEAVTVEGAALRLELALSADGLITLSGGFSGDVVSEFGPLRDVDLTFDGEGPFGRDLADETKAPFTAAGAIRLRSGRVTLAELPSLATLTQEQRDAIFGAPSLSIEAGMDVALTDAGLAITIADAPLMMRAGEAGQEGRAELIVAAEDGAPLFERSDDGARVGFSIAVKGAGLSMAATVDAQSTNDGWSLYLPLQIGDYLSDALSLGHASAVIRADIAPDRINAEVTTTTNLRSASIGRLLIEDAPLTTNLVIDADLAAKRAVITVPGEECITLARARFTLEQQGADAALKDLKLCSGADALVDLNWSGAPRSVFAGKLTADEVHYRIGETHLEGRSPEIHFNGVYQPTDNLTTMSGTFDGGAFMLNELLRFNDARGRFDFSLDRETMRSSSVLNSVRITQNEEAPRIAPVIASGKMALDAETVRFNYVLRTPRGASLGTGEGVHDVTTASGSSTFHFDEVVFAKDGVQPAKLAPALKGYIGETTGAASGSAVFSWAPSGVASSAKFVFQDVTFSGPTRVVNQTIGLTGALEFKNLWPVATDGAQTITVGGIDLDALQLEGGEVRFDMPGDETLRVERALFPWFGGELGVVDAVASLAGGEATAPLRADNIDLTKVLEYVDADGLSGEGLLSGVLPLVVEDGKARIENGFLQSQGPGAIRYSGETATQAGEASDQSQIAFDLLRDLRYDELKVVINGPLDGRLKFKLTFTGTGEVGVNQQQVRVPVIYRVSLDAALLELLNQAVLTQDVELLIERAQQGEE